MPRLKSRLARLRQAPWGLILLGEDPAPVLLLLLSCALVFYPLLEDDWPVIPLALVAAAVVRAWMWSREARAPTGPDGETDEAGAP